MARIKKKKSAAQKTKKKQQPAPEQSSSEKKQKTEASVADAVKSTAKAAAARKKPEKRTAPAKAEPKEPNFIQKGIEFVKEVQIELKKVTWPTRKQTAGTTLVVIILVFIIAMFLGFFDYGLSKLVQVVLA